MKNLKCNYVSEFQDKQYTKGIRAHNKCKKGEYARCTVCGSEKKLQDVK